MSCIDLKNEVVMINLAIEESTISRQVKTAEARVKNHCHVYEASNKFWKKADSMIKKYDEIMDKMSKLNRKCDPVNYEDPPNVSEFLQEKNTLKRAHDGAIMLGTDASHDDTVSLTKKSKTKNLEMEQKITNMQIILFCIDNKNKVK